MICMKRSIKNFGLAVSVVAAMSACNDSANTTAENTDNSMSDTANMTTGDMANESTSAQSDDARLTSELVESMNGGIALMQQGQQKATAKPVKDLAKKLKLSIQPLPMN